MKRRPIAVLLVLVALGFGALGYLALSFNLSALQQPSKLETYLATKAKHWLVARAIAREGSQPAEMPPIPPRRNARLHPRRPHHHGFRAA